MSFKPSGVTYTKATVLSLAQAFTGRSGSPGLFTYKQALVNRRTPLIQRDPAIAQQEALVAVNQKLKAKEVCASIIKNAVASSSAVMLDEVSLEKLTLEECIQTPTPDEYAAYAECQRQKRRWNWAANKEAAKAAKMQQLANHGPFNNKPDSYAYDDHGYHRYVTNLQSATNINKKQLLTQALSSIGSNVNKIHSVIVSECVNCVKCKSSGNTNLMANSSASVHMTMNMKRLKMASVLIQHPRLLNP